MNFDFIKLRKFSYVFSIFVILLGLGSMIFRGFNLGTDFTGGNSIIIRFTDQSVNVSKVRTALADKSIQITNVGSDVIIKTPLLEQKVKDELFAKMQKALGNFDVLENSYVGPSIGKQLRSQAFLILAVTVVIMLFYVTFRFEFWYGLAAVIALFHDMLVMLGFGSLLQVEVNTTFIAAILTILGYSINDTIIIFDRIREETKNNKEHKDLKTLINYSINHTMARSINTLATTMFTVLALYLFGGITIREFALMLLIGLVDGGYSSIFTAAPLYYDMKRSQD
jgi:preprotein translocase subunit SecF